MEGPEPKEHPAQVLAAYLLLTLRHEVLGQRVLAEEARKAADTFQQGFRAPFIARLRTLMDEVPDLNSTAEPVDLARRIRRLIEDEADQRSENEPGWTSGAEDEDTTTQEPDADSDLGNTESSREESPGPRRNPISCACSRRQPCVRSSRRDTGSMPNSRWFHELPG